MTVYISRNKQIFDQYVGTLVQINIGLVNAKLK